MSFAVCRHNPVRKADSPHDAKVFIYLNIPELALWGYESATADRVSNKGWAQRRHPLQLREDGRFSLARGCQIDSFVCGVVVNRPSNYGTNCYPKETVNWND
jgi:hypothetical protein